MNLDRFYCKECKKNTYTLVVCGDPVCFICTASKKEKTLLDFLASIGEWFMSKVDSSWDK